MFAARSAQVFRMRHPPILVVLTSLEGILILRACLVRDLDATSAIVRILKEVDIRALVEAVVTRFSTRRRIKEMNVPEAVRGDPRSDGGHLTAQNVRHYSQRRNVLLARLSRHLVNSTLTEGQCLRHKYGDTVKSTAIARHLS